MRSARNLTPKQLRMRELTALDEKIRQALLGHPLHDRHRLHALQERVHEEIRSLSFDSSPVEG